MIQAITITGYFALIMSTIGAVVCLYFFIKCKADQKYFRLYAAIILFYFAAIYFIALFGANFVDPLNLYYLVRAGILTRIGVISLIGLLVGWTIAENGIK